MSSAVQTGWIRRQTILRMDAGPRRGIDFGGRRSHCLPEDPRRSGPVPAEQIPLFPEVDAHPTGPAPSALEDEPGDAIADLSPDVGQIELFADRVVLARDLDLALEAGRFAHAAEILAALDEDYGPAGVSVWRSALSRLAATAWEEDVPAAALEAWAEMGAQLTGEPALRRRVFTGAFTRLLRSHAAEALAAAQPRCLPALFRALALGLGRGPQDRGLEGRALVRDALLAGRVLEPLDFWSDADVADLLAEDHPPRWLACLGRLRRLWPALPLPDPELVALAPIARGDVDPEDAALGFWHCLRLAESPGCPDELRQQARRRMKQLHPDFHARFMRRAVLA